MKDLVAYIAKALVDKPDEEREHDNVTSGVMQADYGAVTAEDGEIFREAYLCPGGTEGDDPQCVEPVPDTNRRRLQIDHLFFGHDYSPFPILFFRVRKRSDPCPIGNSVPPITISRPRTFSQVLRVAPII